jgi:uncharacterized protein (DUF362 family)
MSLNNNIVSLVKSNDPVKAPIEALALLEENGAFSVPHGGTVFIKPNIVAPVPYQVNPGEMTDPVFVKTIVRYFLENGANRVLVGEIPAWGASCKDAYKTSGLTQAIKNSGGELCDLDEDPDVWVNIDGHVYKELPFPKAIVESDLVVNVPTLKTHFYTDITGGIKNVFGCLRYSERKKFHRDADLFYVLADVLKAISPGLTIIDSISAMEGFGPHAGTTVDFGMTLAGVDAVAVDTVAAHLMGMNPKEVPILEIANRQGLGNNNLAEIEVIGEKVEQNIKKFKLPVFHYINPNENVSIYGGGLCIGCKARMSQIPLNCNPTKKYAVIIGREPITMRSDVETDEIWMVGNCGIRAGMAYLLKRSFKGGFKKGVPNIVKVPGCPTLDWFSQKIVFDPLREKGYMH